MAKYVLKRVLMALFTIFLVATLTFFLMKAVPGNPFVSEKTPPQSVLDALNEKYGLDQPLSVQYFKYMGNLLRGDLGVSVKRQDCGRRRPGICPAAGGFEFLCMMQFIFAP